MASGPFDLVGVVIEELAGAVPRVIGRTRSQLQLAQRLLAALPCLNPARHGDDGGEAPAVAQAEPLEATSARQGVPEVDNARSPSTREPVPVHVPDVVTLAIPDYDSLAASQVVPRLASLDASELSDVGDYERAHRARQTILNRVRQLQADGGSA